MELPGIPLSFRRHQQLSYCSCEPANVFELNTKFFPILQHYTIVELVAWIHMWGQVTTLQPSIQNLIRLAFLYLNTDTSTQSIIPLASRMQLFGFWTFFQTCFISIARSCNFQCLRSTVETPPEEISILKGVSFWSFFSPDFRFLKHFILTVQADDPVLKEALQKYHREGKTNNTEISERLLAEYNITLRYGHRMF